MTSPSSPRAGRSTVSAAGEPRTRRGRRLLDDLRALIPSGLWTPFREEQIAGSIAAVEAEAAASPAGPEARRG